MSEEIHFAGKVYGSPEEFAEFLNTPNEYKVLPIFDTGNRKFDMSEEDFGRIIELAEEHIAIDNGFARALRMTHARTGGTAAHNLTISKLHMLMNYVPNSAAVEDSLMEVMGMVNNHGFPWQDESKQDLWISFYTDAYKRKMDDKDAVLSLQGFKSGASASKGYAVKILEVEAHLSKLKELASTSKLDAINAFMQTHSYFSSNGNSHNQNSY